ncbi:MAG: DUF937 domain-containing protein [Myxococcota bacterium]
MSILDDLVKHLDADTVGSIAGKLGIDPEKAKGAVASALPTIVGALAKNTQSDAGAQKLGQALDKDHDGSLLDQLGAAAPSLADHGQKILAHVFGAKKQAATDGVAQQSGLPVEDVTALLGTLAPIVMGVIGKKKKDEQLDAAGVASALQADRSQAAAKSGGLLGMLDQDGDGDVGNDLMKQGTSLFGSLFGGGDKPAS